MASSPLNLRKAASNGTFTSVASITPGTAFKANSIGLLVGVAGSVNLSMADGSTGVLSLPAGVHRLAVASVASASTTATGLFALY